VVCAKPYPAIIKKRLSLTLVAA